MRNRFIVTAIGVSAFAASAYASDVLVTSQSADELRGNWVIGSAVTSPQGERIGAIEDVMINADEGVVTAAVISVGGFLGFGAKQIAVDWAELQIDWDGEEIVLALTREEADDAPEYSFRDRELPPPPAPEGSVTGGTTTGQY